MGLTALSVFPYLVGWDPTKTGTNSFQWQAMAAIYEIIVRYPMVMHRLDPSVFSHRLFSQAHASLKCIYEYSLPLEATVPIW